MINTNIPANPPQPNTAAPSSSIAGALPSGASIWIKIDSIQAIGADLRPIANQTLTKLLSTGTNLTPLLGNPSSAPSKGLVSTSLTGQAADIPSNLSHSAQLTKLLEAKQLFLAQGMLRSQPIKLITDQALKIGSQLQLQNYEQGLKIVSKADAQTPNLTVNAALSSSENKSKLVNDADRSALNALLRIALPLQQSSAKAVKSLDLLLNQLANKNISAQPAATDAQNLLINKLQKLTTILPINSNAQLLKHAINNSGIFSEAKLAQAIPATQLQSPNASTDANAKTVDQSSADTKLQLWQLFAQLSSTNQTTTAKLGTAPLKDAGLTQQLLNLLGISLDNSAQTTSTKTQLKQALSEVGKQWLAKITAQQLANLIDEPDSKTLKNLTIELPVRVEQQITPLQLHFSKLWHYEESDDEEGKTETKEQKREIVWQVTLSLSVEKLGTIDARIRFVRQKLQCSIWAEQSNTLSLIEKEADKLAQAIQQKGLTVDPINCHAGRMPSPTNRLSQPLLDTHA